MPLREGCLKTDQRQSSALMAGRDSDCFGHRGGGARKQREETALHPDPETGRERGEESNENRDHPLPLSTAVWSKNRDKRI